ncbi:MAG: hypothetical protein JO011_07545, partial [Ktedonobacteraceae bacterium]|nr:hypothetical protein [Ktedonobacteraceae bacterium]
VATFDDQKFYNRHNFGNIIAKDEKYDLKYILALFNSSLLNYWFARQFPNLNINPNDFRQLPVYPASLDEQSTIALLVDALLTKHNELNELRSDGYVIKQRQDGTDVVNVPYDKLLKELQSSDRSFPVLTLLDAKAIGLFSIPPQCDLQAQISSNIYIPSRYPTSIVLKHNTLWFDVPDDGIRHYLVGYLSRPQWQGKTWDEIKNIALIPENDAALNTSFAAEEQKRCYITGLLAEIKRIDVEIDERVLDLYGITDPEDRQRILGSAPLEEEEEISNDEIENTPPLEEL